MYSNRSRSVKIENIYHVSWLVSSLDMSQQFNSNIEQHGGTLYRESSGCIVVDAWNTVPTHCCCIACFPSRATWLSGVCCISSLDIYNGRHNDHVRRIKRTIEHVHDMLSDNDDEYALGELNETLQLSIRMLSVERNHARNLTTWLRRTGDPSIDDPDSVICVF